MVGPDGMEGNLVDFDEDGFMEGTQLVGKIMLHLGLRRHLITVPALGVRKKDCPHAGGKLPETLWPACMGWIPSLEM